MTARRVSLRAWAGVVFVIGLALGTISDEHPARPAVTRGPWRVLQADFHAHTRISDGFLSPPELVIQASRRGLDVLAVTEHNLLFPAEIARWWSELVGGPTILLGEEVTTRAWHLHAIGIHTRVSPSLPLAEVIDEIHRQGGLAIAAHPVKRFWSSFLPVLDRLDGAEVMHPLSLRARPSASGWSGGDLVAFFDEALARGKRLTAIGSSDYHFGAALGRPRTLVFARSDAAEDVMDALRAGRTVVKLPDDRLVGDPACVAAITKDPLPPGMWEAPAREVGLLDRIGRALGVLGLVGLVALGRGGRRKGPELSALRAGSPTSGA